MGAVNANGVAADTIQINIMDTATSDNSVSLGVISVDITAVNDAPVANNDSRLTDEDIDLNNINVLSNDTDLEGNNVSVILASAANGTVSINPDGTLNYGPNTNFNGTDTITYTVSDGDLTDTGIVTITVNAINDNPIARADYFITAQNTRLNHLNVLKNDSDVEHDLLTISTANAGFGEVEINADNTLNYIPAQGFSGQEIIFYTVDDGNGGTSTTEVTIIVSPAIEIIEVIDNIPEAPEEVSVPVPSALPTIEPESEEAPSETIVSLEQGEAIPTKETPLLRPDLSILDSSLLFGTDDTSRKAIPVVNSSMTYSDITSYFELSDSELWQYSQQQAVIHSDSNSTLRNTTASDFNNEQATEVFWANIELMRNQMDEDIEHLEHNIIEIEFVAGATTIGFTAGIVSWVLRGGALLSSLLTSVSVFNKFDPLTMVHQETPNKSPKSTADSKVESMFNKNNIGQ